MGFKSGFHNIVNITPKELKPRTNIEQVITDNIMEKIPCRINDSGYNEFIKIFFLPNDIILNGSVYIREGYLIYSIYDDKTFQVKNTKTIYNKRKPVHVTCICKHAPSQTKVAIK